MRVLRRAAVLILLGLSLGTSGAAAAKARPEIPPRPARAATRSALGLFAPLWRRVTGAWAKEGCGLEPWGRCGTSTPGGTPNQDTDAGCGIEPWGRCSPGH
jgi:hypothetical protein